jgi:hypothetical protein
VRAPDGDWHLGEVPLHARDPLQRPGTSGLAAGTRVLAGLGLGVSTDGAWREYLAATPEDLSGVRRRRVGCSIVRLRPQHLPTPEDSPAFERVHNG